VAGFNTIWPIDKLAAANYFGPPNI